MSSAPIYEFLVLLEFDGASYVRCGLTVVVNVRSLLPGLAEQSVWHYEGLGFECEGFFGLNGPSFGAGHSATFNGGQSLSVMSNAQMRRVVVAKVASAETPEAAEEASAAPAITTILSEAELLKKKAKREELRRKRLVRKRKLRKKGKWPPSKMAKLKNV